MSLARNLKSLVRRRDLWLRGLLAVLVLITVRIFFVYGLDEYRIATTYSAFPNNTARLRGYYAQIDSLNRGHYLKTGWEPGGISGPPNGGLTEYSTSYTRTKRSGIGLHVLLADIALVRKLWRSGAGVMDREDMLRSQYYVIGLAVLLLFLPVIPLRFSIAGAIALTFLQFLKILEWGLWGYWPPTLAALLALVLVWLVIAKESTESSRADRIQLGILLVFLGGLGFLRKDCVYLATFPFLAVAGVNGLLVLRHVAGRLRASASRTWRDVMACLREVPSSARPEFRMLRAAIVALCMLCIVSKVLFYANIAMFEAIEREKHQPMWSGHPIWHNVFIGVGGVVTHDFRSLDPYNHENITWIDTSALYHVRQRRPDIVQVGDPGYFEELKSAYFTVFRNNPSDVIKSVLAKLEHLFIQSGHWVALSTASAFALALLSLGYRRWVGPTTNYLLACGGMFVAVLLPPALVTLNHNGSLGLPLIGSPFLYALGFQAFIIAFPLVSLPIFVGMALADRDQEALPPTVDPPTVHWLLLAGLAVVVAASVAVTDLVDRQWGRTKDCTVRLANGRASLADLSQEYQAIAVRAFNSLPDHYRQSMAAADIKGAGRAVGCSIQDVSSHPNVQFSQIRWAGDKVLCLVRVTGVARGLNVPVHLRYDDAPPPEPLRSNFLLLFPTILRPGVWLFSFQAAPHVRQISLGVPEARGPQTYGSPMPKLLLTVTPTPPR